VVDWLPALLFLAVDELNAVTHHAGHAQGGAWADAAVSLVMMGSLGFRRRFPLLVLALVAGGAVAQATRLPAGEQGSFQAFIALCFAGFSAGMYTTGRRPLVVAMAVPGILLPALTLLRNEAVGAEGIPNWFWAAACAGVGRLLSDRQRLVWLLEDRALRLEREREEKAKAAVSEERARIAREMHDVVAHNVSVIVVQAGAARRVMEADRVRASEALAAIEMTGRQTLQEMRRLLGVLRTDDDVLALSPQPGLAELGALIDEVRKAGMPVDFREEGIPHELPPGHDLVAYRVVQEALTNVLKHAGQAKVWITLKFTSRSLELEVLDDGRGPTHSGEPEGGHGLFGMRERLALYGGTLETGERPGGGFSLRACLPFEQGQ
jgi:signal transduction histidine kinase